MSCIGLSAVAELTCLDATYVMSILFTSTEPHYLMANAAWLAGSGLTIFLDVFVLAQFAVFSIQDKRERKDRMFVDDEQGQEAEAA